jgi:hypothetical protein
LDDDFEVEEGYTGQLQFGVVLRDPLIADLRKSNSIESSSGENENTNIVYSTAVFSNFSFIGPIKTRSAQYNLNLQSALHLSKNSSVSLINSLLMGYPNGIILEGDKVDFNAWSQQISLKNNIIAGCFTPLVKNSSGIWDFTTWFQSPSLKNRLIGDCIDIKLKDPFNIYAPNFMPMPDSPCLGGVFMFQ